MDNLSDFYLLQSEPVGSCLLALRNIILKLDSQHIRETKKYGMPCFSYQNKAFCYLWKDKKTDEPYLLLVEGKLLDHPDLEEGTRKKMKILRVNSTEDIPLKTMEEVLEKALDLYRNGVLKMKE